MNMTSPHHPLQVGGPLHLVRGAAGLRQRATPLSLVLNVSSGMRSAQDILHHYLPPIRQGVETLSSLG